MLAYLRLLRPRQMSKNAFCFAGVVFSGRFVYLESNIAAALTFAAFCACSSAVYILNDVIDQERDREHPRKRLRPIASGKVSVPVALLLGTILVVASFLLGALINWAVVVCLGLYLINNAAYSLGLKHVALIDVLSIALGFVLRLVAGAYAVGELPTTWFTLCTFFLSIFLGSAKRRAELAGIVPEKEKLQRPVLREYSVQYLDQLVNSSAAMAVMCYALFTVMSHKNPALIITVPIVFFAVMYYKRLVMVEKCGEEPERTVVGNRYLLASVILWLIAYFGIIYGDFHLFR